MEEVVEIRDIQGLIADVNRIYKHQQEIKKLKGEHFNIFFVLGVESHENATHSAFLGELLNPLGSHLFGGLFLKHFLTTVGHQGAFDLNSASIQLEKHIGSVDLTNKTGGRIDLFLSDGLGNSISIENKIFAVDQMSQIERYVNYHTASNTVYYLNLNGDSPKEFSTGGLIDGDQYHIISYRDTIVKWLSTCLKESAEQPILRESIRQYILLIKKLTNQLTDHVMEDQVHALIKNNFNAAKIIADNLWKVELDFANIFLSEIKESLIVEFGEKCTVMIDDDLNKTWTGLSIKFEEWDGIEVRLEGQSKVAWSHSIYGIRAHKDHWSRESFVKELADVTMLQNGFNSSAFWPYNRTILNFGQASEREKLFDLATRQLLVSSTSEELIELVKACRLPLTRITKTVK